MDICGSRDTRQWPSERIGNEIVAFEECVSESRFRDLGNSGKMCAHSLAERHSDAARQPELGDNVRANAEAYRLENHSSRRGVTPPRQIQLSRPDHEKVAVAEFSRRTMFPRSFA